MASAPYPDQPAGCGRRRSRMKAGDGKRAGVCNWCSDPPLEPQPGGVDVLYPAGVKVDRHQPVRCAGDDEARAPAGTRCSRGPTGRAVTTRSPTSNSAARRRRSRAARTTSTVPVRRRPSCPSAALSTARPTHVGSGGNLGRQSATRGVRGGPPQPRRRDGRPPRRSRPSSKHYAAALLSSVLLEPEDLGSVEDDVSTSARGPRGATLRCPSVWQPSPEQSRNARWHLP